MGGPVMLKGCGYCGYFNGRDVRGGGEGEEKREREAGREEEERGRETGMRPDLPVSLISRCASSSCLVVAVLRYFLIAQSVLPNKIPLKTSA